MYRTFISIALLCTVAAQETNTTTYVKIPPVDPSTEPAPPEDLPLNVPVSLGDLEDEVTTEADVTTEAATTTRPVITTSRPFTTTRKFQRKPFRSSPRFISKLSYYNEEDPTRNVIEKFSKRTYKSKCRCAKIWNCPKLQISVPRCPNEYFMCCF